MRSVVCHPVPKNTCARSITDGRQHNRSFNPGEHMRSRIAVFAFLTTTAFTTAGAQIGGTLGKILNGLGKIAGPPPPVQIVGRAAMSGGDSALVARLRADTSTTRTTATTPCGSQRLCTPGWDLRVVSAAPPAAEVPAGTPIPITVDVENRGRAPAPASEVQICSGDAREPCQSKLELVPLPALASGEHIRLVRKLMSGDAYGTPRVIAAIIDPDNATGEANRNNNTGVSTPFQVEQPQLEIVGMQADPQTAADGTERISIAIRNPSMSVPTPPTQLCICRRPYASNGDSQYTLDFPALAPRQTISFTARVRVVEPKQTGTWDTWLYVAIDPSNKYHWRDMQPYSQSTQFHVVAGR